MGLGNLWRTLTAHRLLRAAVEEAATCRRPQRLGLGPFSAAAQHQAPTNGWLIPSSVDLTQAPESTQCRCQNQQKSGLAAGLTAPKDDQVGCESLAGAGWGLFVAGRADQSFAGQLQPAASQLVASSVGSAGLLAVLALHELTALMIDVTVAAGLAVADVSADGCHPGQVQQHQPQEHQFLQQNTVSLFGHAAMLRVCQSDATHCISDQPSMHRSPFLRQMCRKFSRCKPRPSTLAVHGQPGGLVTVHTISKLGGRGVVASQSTELRSSGPASMAQSTCWI
eukprot:SAG31_NODE_82_length_27046_cov_45.857275_21_plen_281_part_00